MNTELLFEKYYIFSSLLEIFINENSIWFLFFKMRFEALKYKTVQKNICSKKYLFIKIIIYVIMRFIFRRLQQLNQKQIYIYICFDFNLVYLIYLINCYYLNFQISYILRVRFF
jgi:hypothetical protein